MSQIPLISSGSTGALGALHLPRLWQKVSLSANGALADGYDECGQGFDQMTLDGLKIDRDAAINHIKSNKPSYAQFEAWVKAQRGGSIPQSEIDEHNAAISGYEHDDETRKAILDAAGIADDGSVRDAVTLNNIDDWTDFHGGL